MSERLHGAAARAGRTGRLQRHQQPGVLPGVLPPSPDVPNWLPLPPRRLCGQFLVFATPNQLLAQLLAASLNQLWTIL